MRKFSSVTRPLFPIFMVGSLDEATSTEPMSQHIVPSDIRPDDEVVRVKALSIIVSNLT